VSGTLPERYARLRSGIAGEASRRAHRFHHCWPTFTLRRFVLGWKKLGLERSLGTRLVTSNMIEEVRFAVDSLLEGDGFEPSVPRKNFWAAPSIPPQFTFRNITGSLMTGTDGSNSSPSSAKSDANLTFSRHGDENPNRPGGSVSNLPAGRRAKSLSRSLVGSDLKFQQCCADLSGESARTGMSGV
jgi:hypothetical protein